MIRRLAAWLARLAALLLPPPARDWGRAMEVEAAAIERPAVALSFALGCLGCALREAARYLFSCLRWETRPMTMWTSLSDRPRHLAALCACGATGLGLAYMAVSGAPLSYLAMNASAFALGLLALGILAQLAPPGPAASSALNLALALTLLLVSLLGVSAGGVTRWIAVGGVLLQPGPILLPILALRFARSQDGPSTLAITIAALALALQPDRAMAGALAAAMTALAVIRPGREALVGAGAAVAALAVTMVRPDPSPAVPFVDQIFYASFDIHPLAGTAVLVGALLILVPPLVGWRVDAGNRELYAVFGFFWLAVLAAAALGNYPTPFVGYSGSAILGYMIGLAGLPPRNQAVDADRASPRRDSTSERPQLRLSLPETEMARSSFASR